MSSSTSFDPGPLAQVAVDRSGPGWTLVFVRDLAHGPERVWSALTDPEQLGKWAPYTSDRDLGTAGDATLTMLDDESAADPDLPAVVRTADRPNVLEHTWGDDTLRWELEPTATGTRLTLRHTVTEQDLMPKVAAGWHLCLVVAEQVLDGRPSTPIRGDDAHGYGWEDLRAAYAEVLES